MQGVAGDDAAGIAAMTIDAYESSSGASLNTDIPATDANDAAVANMGSPCRMPTKEEFQELYDNCDWTWKQVNGVYGYEVKSKASGNTNSIFLPAAGYVDDGALSNVGTLGEYWSSSIDGDTEGFAYYLDFGSESVGPDNSDSRYYGYSVRAVQ